MKLFYYQKNASVVTFITWFIAIHMTLDVDKTLWLQSGYYFAHLQRAVVLESVRKWVTGTTHTSKGHMYRIRWADVTYGTCQNCNMVCYFVTVEGHFWAHLWNPTVTRTRSTISWNYSGWNFAYGEKQRIVIGCSVCGHCDVHCLLFCFTICTNSYIVLVSMHFLMALSIIQSDILVTLSLIISSSS